MEPDEFDDLTGVEEEPQDETSDTDSSTTSDDAEDASSETAGNSTSDEAATNSSEDSTDTNPKSVDTTQTDRDERHVEENENTDGNVGNEELYMADEVYTLTVYINEDDGGTNLTITLKQHSDNTTTTQETNGESLVEFDVTSGDYTIIGTDQNGNSTETDITVDEDDLEVTLRFSS